MALSKHPPSLSLLSSSATAPTKPMSHLEFWLNQYVGDGHCFRNVELFPDPSCYHNVLLHRLDAVLLLIQKQARFFSTFHRFLFYERLHLLALEFLESAGLLLLEDPSPENSAFV
ncbi:hypothetical protein OPV22_011915 [Ensete ventricosum]|uniref:Uncharacterized protein n=1 Tax=Ensete ventricosum TaxID=4639 RepID=A0AAV8RLX2_ENSVE|nr:hypothetical protein OPV22_011915 [Ensete ventricosum]